MSREPRNQENVFPLHGGISLQENRDDEAIAKQPPFGSTEDSVLVISGDGFQDSPAWMTNGMDLLDLYESSVSHDGFGAESFRKWLSLADSLRAADESTEVSDGQGS